MGNTLSKLLRTEIATSFRGRSLTTEMFPFSFQEYLRYHSLFTDTPDSFGSKNAAILRNTVKHILKPIAILINTCYEKLMYH